MLTAIHGTEHRVPIEGAREIPSEFPGTKLPTKEYTWRDPWLQLHM
ncbi:hypothetical protein T09_10436 [Trichinella sp. T9]|nr:hypothetical protein T09_10436 [Trichinella sp. T9]